MSYRKLRLSLGMLGIGARGGRGLKSKVSVKSRRCPDECVAAAAAVVGVAVKRWCCTRSGDVHRYIQRVYIHP